MTAQQRLWHTWRGQLRALLPEVRVTRVDGLALLVVGLLLAKHVALTRIAAAAPAAADDPSIERRLRRWLANDAIAVGAIWGRVLPAVLGAARSAHPLFVFDPTPPSDRFTVLVVGIVEHTRVLPVAWRLVPQQAAWPVPMEELLRAMLAEIAAALPTGTTPTLLVDRGITSARMVDVCRAAGWGFVFRVNAGPTQTNRARLADAEERRVWDLVTGPGQRLARPIALFKDAGWREVQLTIHWGRGEAEPWILVSDAPAGAARTAEYRRRSRCEATYLDLKSRGWDVEATKLTDPARLDRLLLGLHLAFCWAHGLGLRAIRAGERHRYDRRDRRDKGVIKLGWAVLAARLRAGRLPALPFSRDNGTWRLSYAP